VVEEIVGHSNPAITRLYTHVSELAATHAVNSLPAVIGDTPAPGPAVSRDEQLREIIEGVTPKTWKRDKARLLAILDGKEQ